MTEAIKADIETALRSMDLSAYRATFPKERPEWFYHDRLVRAVMHTKRLEIADLRKSERSKSKVFLRRYKRHIESRRRKTVAEAMAGVEAVVARLDEHHLKYVPDLVVGALERFVERVIPAKS